MALETPCHEVPEWYFHSPSASPPSDVDTDGSGHYTANCLLFQLITYSF